MERLGEICGLPDRTELDRPEAEEGDAGEWGEMGAEPEPPGEGEEVGRSVYACA